MLMRSSFVLPEAPRVYPEIAGKRVLITGITSCRGADLAVTLAEHDARLVLAFEGDDPAVTALVELVAQHAEDLQVFTEPVADAATAVELARAAATAHGSLDVVVNFMELSRFGALGSAFAAPEPDDLEGHVAACLTTPYLATHVLANRMNLTMTEGLILNVATAPAALSGSGRALAQLGKSALTDMTRAEARRWARAGIRINAIAPTLAGGASDSEPSSRASERDITALALFLASGRGRALSGHVFDATGVARVAI